MESMTIPIAGQETPLQASQQASPQTAGKPLDNTISPGEAFKAGENANIPKITNILDGAGGSRPNIVTAGMLSNEGKLGVKVMDSVFPALLVLGFTALGSKVKKSDFQLTSSETDTLAPFMKAYLDTIQINFDKPWVALLVTAGFIYGAKVVEIGGLDFIDKINLKKAAKGDSAGAAKQAAVDVNANSDEKNWRVMIEKEYRRLLDMANKYVPTQTEVDAVKIEKSMNADKAKRSIVAQKKREAGDWFKQQVYKPKN